MARCRNMRFSKIWCTGNEVLQNFSKSVACHTLTEFSGHNRDLISFSRSSSGPRHICFYCRDWLWNFCEICVSYNMFKFYVTRKRSNLRLGKVIYGGHQDPLCSTLHSSCNLANTGKTSTKYNIQSAAKCRKNRQQQTPASQNQKK